MSTPINTIYSWFETGDFPTQAQFQASWSSFWHKDEEIPLDKISGLIQLFNQTATKESLTNHFTDPDAHENALAKRNASNLDNTNIDDWRSKLGVSDIPDNVALVDYGENQQVYNKDQIESLTMMLDDFVVNGKITADKIEALGLTDLIEASENTLNDFVANVDNYAFQDNDFIAIPDTNGDYSLFIYKGGDKTVSGNYLPTGLTNITIAMVNGLQSALDSKLNKPTGTGFFFIANGGSAEPTYSPINPASYYVTFWNGSSFQATNIYYNQSSQKVGIGTGNTTLNYMLEVNGSAKVSSLVISNAVNANSDATFTRQLVQKPDGTIGHKLLSSTPPKRPAVYQPDGSWTITDTFADVIRMGLSESGAQPTYTIRHTDVYPAFFITTSFYSTWQPPKLKPISGETLLIAPKGANEIYVSDTQTYQLKTSTTYLVSKVGSVTYIIEL